MMPDEKERYTMTPKKYRSKENKKNEFGKGAWILEGKQFYITAWGKRRKFLSSPDLWDRVVMAW